MPIVLKKRERNCPGVIIFAHNEILRGIVKKSLKVRQILSRENKSKKWIFGIHVQGDPSNIKSWPLEDWHDFLMWPNKEDPFLKKINKNKITNLTCINFLDINKKNSYLKLKKVFDLVSVTRFSSGKNVHLTLNIFEELSLKNKNYKFCLIAPKLKFSKKNFFLNKENLYLIKISFLIYRLKKNKNIKFLISDSKADFPLSQKKIYETIAKSKFLILNSYREGVPRVIAEALYLNTKIIISDKLKHGLSSHLNRNNSFIFHEKNNQFNLYLNEIHKTLSLKEKKDFKIKGDFFEGTNKIKIYNFINKIFKSKKINTKKINSSWLLHNLKYRLASHFKVQNHQIFNSEKLFLQWFYHVNYDKNYTDEKYNILFKKDHMNIYLELKYFIFRLKKFIFNKFRK